MSVQPSSSLLESPPPRRPTNRFSGRALTPIEATRAHPTHTPAPLPTPTPQLASPSPDHLIRLPWKLRFSSAANAASARRHLSSSAAASLPAASSWRKIRLLVQKLMTWIKRLLKKPY
jgi:hypothetical protein